MATATMRESTRIMKNPQSAGQGLLVPAAEGAVTAPHCMPRVPPADPGAPARGSAGQAQELPDRGELTACLRETGPVRHAELGDVPLTVADRHAVGDEKVGPTGPFQFEELLARRVVALRPRDQRLGDSRETAEVAPEEPLAGLGPLAVAPL